jgi:hypothetical protein
MRLQSSEHGVVATGKHSFIEVGHQVCGLTGSDAGVEQLKAVGAAVDSTAGTRTGYLLS